MSLIKNDLPEGAKLLEMEEEQTTELNLDEQGEPVDGQPYKECISTERKRQKGSYINSVILHSEFYYIFTFYF